MRIDILMVNRGLVPTRSKAKQLIEAGEVFVDNKKIIKAGYNVSNDAEIEIISENLPYVSRGGLKIKHAIDEFLINIENKICMDVGASTGGFTDCMLQHKAKKVYAIDVGTNQLVDSLKQDNRVECIENCNFRYFDHSTLTEKIDFVSIDVSFISLELILPKVFEVISDGGEVVALIKPQFEVGRISGFKGVVKDEKLHKKVVDQIRQSARLIGFTVNGVTTSPVKEKNGNTEFLIYLSV